MFMFCIINKYLDAYIAFELFIFSPYKQLLYNIVVKYVYEGYWYDMCTLLNCVVISAVIYIKWKWDFAT